MSQEEPMTHTANANALDVLWTGIYYDHHTGDAGEDSGHTTAGGRVFGVLPIRYTDCDQYGCRAVVVLDPHDRAQVERFCAAMAAQGLTDTPWDERTDEDRSTVVRAAAAALRSLLRPPEPRGLGAVVEAIHGNHFVRVAAGRSPWQRVSDAEGEHLVAWADIAAVRVLSEGVVV